MPRRYCPRGISLSEKIDFYSVRDPVTNCRLWRGYIDPEWGYGRIWWNDRLWLVHRAAYVDAKGPIPDEVKVLHKCDTPACSELEHLFDGSDADNNADMYAKGRDRHPRGESLPFSKLTEDEVRAIRADTRAQVRIAAQYGIGQSAVSSIKRRETWKHVT